MEQINNNSSLDYALELYKLGYLRGPENAIVEIIILKYKLITYIKLLDVALDAIKSNVKKDIQLE